MLKQRFRTRRTVKSTAAIVPEVVFLMNFLTDTATATEESPRALGLQWETLPGSFIADPMDVGNFAFQSPSGLSRAGGWTSGGEEVMMPPVSSMCLEVACSFGSHVGSDSGSTPVYADLATGTGYVLTLGVGMDYTGARYASVSLFDATLTPDPLGYEAGAIFDVEDDEPVVCRLEVGSSGFKFYLNDSLFYQDSSSLDFSRFSSEERAIQVRFGSPSSFFMPEGLVAPCVTSAIRLTLNGVPSDHSLPYTATL